MDSFLTLAAFFCCYILGERRLLTKNPSSHLCNRSNLGTLDIAIHTMDCSCLEGKEELIVYSSDNMDTVSSDASIDVKNLETSLKQELGTLYHLSNGCCIYRVPQPIRLLNERAYTPKVVSIGPLHHGTEELKAMEEYKRRCLQDFLQRTNQVDMKNFLELIKAKEKDLRDCYAESIKLESDDFVKMILVDSAFLIEILLRNCLPELKRSGDRIFTKPWMINHIMPDLWLLENQLPRFILEELFELANIMVPTSTGAVEKLSMVELNCKFWSSVYQFLLVEDYLIEYHFPEAAHFLDLLRLCLQPIYPVRQPEEVKSLTTPSVKELQEAGVQFKVGSSKNLFDISFDNGILEIPHLRTTIATESLIRNLQVFEQLHNNTSCMTDYVIIMNCLVNSPKDADILIQNGVIENRLKDSEGVSNLFHNLVEWSSGLSNFFFYHYLVEELNKYCRTPWHRWKANLKQNYFNTPWASISVIAAVILLVLTFVQTFYSVIK